MQKMTNAIITAQEFITWKYLTLNSACLNNWRFLAYGIERGFSRKGVPVAIMMKFDKSMTRSYSYRICYISRFESIEIFLILFLGFRVRDSCIATLAEIVELADFNFWFWNKKTLFGSSYDMGTPSRWAAVAIVTYKDVVSFRMTFYMLVYSLL